MSDGAFRLVVAEPIHRDVERGACRSTAAHADRSPADGRAPLFWR